MIDNESSVESDDAHSDEEQEEDCSTDDINAYRKQVENEVSFSQEKSKANDSIRDYIESCTKYLSNIIIGPEVEVPDELSPPINISNMASTNNLDSLKQTEEEHTKVHVPVTLDDSKDSNTEDISELGSIDKNSRLYRLQMVEKLLSDTRSQRSLSTSASTIAPSVITGRIRKTLNVKEKREIRKKCVAKGEASALHRHRNENKDIVKEFAGWEF